MPRGVRRVRKRLADGSIKVYEYRHAPVGRSKPTPLPANCIRDLISAYQRSPEWHALAPRTQKNRIIALRHADDAKHVAVADLRRRQIMVIRDGIAMGIGPAAANAFVSAMSVLLAWARDRGWIEFNPADRIKAIAGGHYPTWSESDLTAALGDAPPELRRALLFAVHTGQRRGDLITARWPDVADGVWRVKQEKTGARLAVPLHPALLAEMAGWTKTAVTVLTTAKGTPWDRDGLTMAVMRHMEGIGRKGLNIHGLRKLAAVRLADAGCSIHEIAAITGHASLSQVALYTKEADQVRLAKAAVLRLQKNQSETG